jgi:hypothetical protein
MKLALQAISAFRCNARLPSFLTGVSRRRTIDKAMRYVSSQHGSLAKFATRLIAHTKNKATLCEQVVEVRILIYATKCFLTHYEENNWKSQKH